MTLALPLPLCCHLLTELLIRPHHLAQPRLPMKGVLYFPRYALAGQEDFGRKRNVPVEIIS